MWLCINLFLKKLILTQNDEKINKFTGYQLPNKFKIIGLVIVIVSFLSIMTSLDTYILEEKFYLMINMILILKLQVILIYY